MYDTSSSLVIVKKMSNSIVMEISSTLVNMCDISSTTIMYEYSS